MRKGARWKGAGQQLSHWTRSREKTEGLMGVSELIVVHGCAWRPLFLCWGPAAARGRLSGPLPAFEEAFFKVTATQSLPRVTRSALSPWPR